MANKTLCFTLSFSCFIIAAHGLEPNKKSQKSSPTVTKLLNAYKELESQLNLQLGQALRMIDKYSSEAPVVDARAGTWTSKDLEAELTQLTARVENIQGIIEQLLLLHVSSMISIQISSVSLAMDLANNGFANTSAAKVPLPEVFAIVNSSVNFSCTSDGGQPLSMCLWERRADGQREMIQMEEEEHAPKVTDKALSDGRLNITVEDLEDGNCTLRIFSVRETDSGHWSCTLVAKGGSAFTGDIYVEVTDTPPKIYFTTLEGGVRAYFFPAGNVSVASDGKGDILGVVYDPTDKMLYFSFWDGIVRAGINDSEATSVLSSMQYHGFKGLALDWITGNIFGVSWDGFVFVCNYETAERKQFDCVTILRGEGTLNGIAVDPTKGTMYWTADGGFVGWAYMDGSSRTTIVEGLGELRGIAIDYQSARLYWADETRRQIHSSDLLGDDYKQVYQLPQGSKPTGLVLLHDRIYWADWERCGLYSIRKSGKDWRNVHTGNFSIRHLATNTLNQPRNRINHCAGHECPDFCVLTKNSFQCLS